MGWLSALGGFIGNNAGSIVNAGAQIYGAKQASKANDQAAQISQQATGEQIGLAREVQEAQQRRLDQLTASSQPGLDYLRNLTTQQPDGLTAQQQIQLQDLNRNAVASATKAGLAGAGRTVAAIVNDTGNRFMADATANNQRRSDAAAGTLAVQNANAITQANNVDANAGNTVSGLVGSNAMNQANAGTNSATANQSAIGAIGSIFANAVKDNQRNSEYEKAISTNV